MNYDFQARDQLEDIILGSIMLHDMHLACKEIVLVKHKLDKPEYFRTKFNQDVFETILRCWEQDLPTDIVTVSNMRPSEYRVPDNHSYCKGFDINIITMTQRISSAAHLDYHIMILKQYILIDYWNKKAMDILYSRWDNRDVLIVTDNIIEGHNLLLESLIQNIKIDSSNEDLIKSEQENYDRVQNGNIVSIPIGVTEIDEFTGGWQPSELSVVGARPGMGKTTVTLVLATKSSFEYNKKGAFITLEMTKKQLMNKIIAKETGLDYQDIKNYRLTKEQFETVKWWYNYFKTQSKLTIYDMNDCRTLEEIISKISSGGFEYAIIDYLQLVKLGKSINKNGNREQDVAEVSRNLKLTANTLDIPIIALAQLSRSTETRGANKRPMLSDLRESGSLEQDADNVIFLYRDAYYRKVAGEIVPEIEEGNIEWIVAKGRETGTKNFKFHIDLKNYEIKNEFQFNGMEQAPPPPIP